MKYWLEKGVTDQDMKQLELKIQDIDVTFDERMPALLEELCSLRTLGECERGVQTSSREVGPLRESNEVNKVVQEEKKEKNSVSDQFFGKENDVSTRSRLSSFQQLSGDEKQAEGIASVYRKPNCIQGKDVSLTCSRALILMFSGDKLRRASS